MNPNPVMKNNRMLPRARELRRDMTPQEKKLWYQFLRHHPVKFYKQRIIDSFIADFYCASARLVIEVDGMQHYTEQGKAYDEQRTAIISRYGIKVLRFSNEEIDEHFETVKATIDAETAQRLVGDETEAGELLTKDINRGGKNNA